MSELNHGSSRQQNRRLLIVDDEKMVCDTFCRMMSQHMLVVGALSAKQALQELAEKTFFAVVTDFNMPEMNGLELLRQVHRQYPHTLRILVSGALPGSVEEVERCEEVHHFLPKPVAVTQLLSILAWSSSGSNHCQSS